MRIPLSTWYLRSVHHYFVIFTDRKLFKNLGVAKAESYRTTLIDIPGLAGEAEGGRP